VVIIPENMVHSGGPHMVLNIACKNCNFKTGQSTCWHFGEMNLTRIVNMAIQGCDKHRFWWTMTPSVKE
jgi:hypothetical protein